jgi:hypothetical protein
VAGLGLSYDFLKTGCLGWASDNFDAVTNESFSQKFHHRASWHLFLKALFGE